MKNKIYILCLAMVLLSLMFLSFIQADEYLYAQQNSILSEYSFNSEISIVPFSKYDLIEMCTEKFVIDEVMGSETTYLPLDVMSLELDCDDYFLYSIVNSLIYNKENIIIIYNATAESIEIQAVLDFANLFSISAYADTEPFELTPSIVFIGNSNLLLYTYEDFNLGESESVIYVNEQEAMNHIAIVGSNSMHTINSIELLTGIYNADFANNDCVIFSGCSLGADTDGDGTIDIAEILLYTDRWVQEEIDLDSLLEEIGKWEKDV